jgi:hypothetical protein
MSSCMLGMAKVLSGSSSTLALPLIITPSFHWTLKLMMWPLYQGGRRAGPLSEGPL